MILAKPLAQQRSLSGKLWMIPNSLSHNAGIITALIGSTTYSCTLSGLVANTRYQLYVVPGSTTLQFSTRENSLGPIGFSNWILIGSFYADGLSPIGFGSFVNIDGKPESLEWRADNVFLSSISGFGVPSQQHLSLRRMGGNARGVFHFRSGTSTVADARFSLTNLGIDVARVIANANVTARKHTYGWAVGGNPSSTGTFAPSELQFYLFYNGTYPQEISITDGFQSSGGTEGYPRQVGGDSILSANASMQGEFEVPITGWSNTPLKDL